MAPSKKHSAYAPKPFEHSLLLQHFAIKPPASAGGSATLSRREGAIAASIAAGQNSVTLLDGKRALNTQIALRKLRVKPDGSLTAALLTLDEAFLTADACETLLKVIPTPEEREMVHSLSEADIANMDENEKVFVEMARMPHLQTRLTALLAIRRFGALAEEASKSTRRAAGALRTLRESDGIRALLGSILSVGNALNAGSAQRGGALGYKLDSMLCTVLGMRSGHDPKLTLIHFVARHMASYHAECAPTAACEAAAITASLELTPSVLKTESASLAEATEKVAHADNVIRGQASSLATSTSGNFALDGDAFPDVARAFAASAAAVQKELTAELLETTHERAALACYLCETDGTLDGALLALQETVAAYLAAKQDNDLFDDVLKADERRKEETVRREETSKRVRERRQTVAGNSTRPTGYRLTAAHASLSVHSSVVKESAGVRKARRESGGRNSGSGSRGVASPFAIAASPRSRVTMASPRSGPKRTQWQRPSTGTRLERSGVSSFPGQGDGDSFLSPKSRRAAPLGMGSASAAAAAIAREAMALKAIRNLPPPPPPPSAFQAQMQMPGCDDLLPGVLGSLHEGMSMPAVLAKARSRESTITTSPLSSGFSPGSVQPGSMRMSMGPGAEQFHDFESNSAALDGMMNDPRNEEGWCSDDGEDDLDDPRRSADPAPLASDSFVASGASFAAAGSSSGAGFQQRQAFAFGAGRLNSSELKNTLFTELSSNTRQLRNTMAGTAVRPRFNSVSSPGEDLRAAELAAIFSRRKNGMSITPSKAPSFRF